jgi:hypothetical protein
MIPENVKIRAQRHVGPDFGLARAAEIIASGGTIHVVQVYAQDVKLPHGKETRQAGVYVHGMDITVYGRRASLLAAGAAARGEAEISWPSLGSSDTARAALFAQMMSIAAGLAETANGMDDVTADERLLPALADRVGKDDIRMVAGVTRDAFRQRGCTVAEAVEMGLAWYADRQARLERAAAMQGVTADELLERLARYPGVIPPAFAAAASATAGMSAGGIGELAAREDDQETRAALLEIQRDRAQFGMRPQR